MPIHPQWVTTAFGFDGYRITSHRGVVRAAGVTEVLAYGTAVVVEPSGV